MIEIYTDGSCRGNGKEINQGGFGVVVIKDGVVQSAFQQASENTTNNREELKAILYAVGTYGDKGEELTIYSDSQYCISTFTDWMFSWKKRGWVKSDKKTPENLDLIQIYDKMLDDGYKANLVHVKGHMNNKWNEIADKLATFKISPSEVEA